MLSEEHRAIQDSVRAFVRAEVDPIASKLDNEGAEIPMPLIRKMAGLGYFGLIFDAAYGGSGLDTMSMAIVAEELSRAWLSVGSVMTRMIISASLIQAHGTKEQKERFLPKLCSGELLAAAAFTEPDAGSDAAAVKTRAIREGNSYRLQGEKAWCTFANRAHLLVTTVRTNPGGDKHKGISILLVEKEPGDAFAPPSMSASPIPTIGYKGMNSYNVAFDSYIVPAENLLGGVEGQGFYQLMASYEYARIQTAARAVGVAQATPRFSMRRTESNSGNPSATFKSSGTSLLTPDLRSKPRAS
jgi:(2S)-methylsuccinyl-CoA dehydrogenase